MSTPTLPSADQSGVGRQKWTRVLLVVSLTLNLLVLGLVIGAKLGGHRDQGFDPRGPNRGAIRDLGFAPVAGALERSDRREIGKILRDRSGSFAENRKKLEAEFQDMLSTLRADPFDPEALLLTMTQQSERMRQRGELARSVLVERIAQMSMSERREFADRIERSIRKRAP
ncbi:periplasmic heavy metal sensor [Aliiroseovarius sp. F47248L]|uniref:periplasmic heavy metal sensor n=1 Tax=Aliiroseovarius sp. F47248L TaxID=2926420 RepID=UPI001FF55EC9|nr:periplasmic heavy metal sensor [Aliiroseovarius sp. F47248L]MCK0138412.1 periplasmic heavy metal sensor [Aliiroseovarius sp. F47248L]